MHRILFVQKNSSLQETISSKSAVINKGLQLDASSSLAHALKEHNKNPYSLILLDYSLAQIDSVRLSQFSPYAKVIVTDEHPSIANARHAFKFGASDYLELTKSDHIISVIKEHIAQHNASTKHQEGLIGDCKEMLQVFKHIDKAAPTNCNVLILGETGTGKELVAKSIHHNSSRSANPLICVNCAAIPETLIESELFGYEKGAFTGANANRQGLIEAAHNGTLFLDEIGELPLEAQARLLRFIQEGEIRRIGSVTPRKVDVRLIVATHRNLKQLCSQNNFREDLFYRINVMQINLPPLRERGDDISTIAKTLLSDACIQLNHPQKTFSNQAITILSQYSWPGNIRELRNIIERAVILSEHDDQEINTDVLAIEIEYVQETNLPHIAHQIQTASPSVTPISSTKKSTLAENDNIEDSNSLSLEDYFMSFVLEHQDTMSETELAKKLGVSRKCLWERRQRLGIPRKKDNKHSSSP